MLRFLAFSVCLIAMVVLGCGEMRQEHAKAAAGKKPTKEKPTKEKPKVEIAVVEVKADAFPTAEAALAALEANFKAPEGQERKDQEVRVQKWLVMQGEKSVPAVAARASGAKESLEMRITACRILGQLGPTAVDSLIELAEKAESAQLRRKAIESLGMVKPEKKVVDELIKLLDDPDTLIQWQAINGLIKIGPPAKDAATKLGQLRKDHKDEQIRVSAGEALKKVDPRTTFVD